MHTKLPVEHIIESSLVALGFEMVACYFTSYRNTLGLRVFIDHPKGIAVGDCERASKQIMATLNVEAPTLGPYTLEVSSPGLDRPLVTLAHYQRFIGHLVHVKLRESQDGRKNFSGKLLNVIDDKITLLLEKEETIVLPFEHIEKANLIPEVRFKS